ncbi:MAG: adenylyltransferase/cytidyltransferase family protein [Flavobacteriaceae bacterium]
MTLYTGGTFDIFHYGHMNFLKKCSLLADRVVVSLNTDEFIEEYKGRPPVMSYAEREASIKNFHYVDDVIPNVGGKDSKVSILQVRPDIIAIGDDWARKDYYAQMNFTQEWLDENEILLVYLPYTKGISTTEIKRRLIDYGY